MNKNYRTQTKETVEKLSVLVYTIAIERLLHAGGSMKDLYDVARHLVWLTQFGLSVCVPPILFVPISVWLRKALSLGSWIVAVGVILGILGAVSSLRYSLKAIERQGREPKKKSSPPVSFNHHG